MRAYEECLPATSTEEAPWHIIPSDDKLNARLIISAAILRVLKSLKLGTLEPNQQRRSDLLKIRKMLVKE